MKYRAKPVVVDAIQYNKNFPEIEEFVGFDLDVRGKQIDGIEGVTIKPINYSDWLVQFDDGIIQHMTDIEFQQRFEKVSDLIVEWTATSESSNIAGYHYDGSSEILTIEFVGGGRYNYFEVKENLFLDFQKEKSKGTFFHTRIKDCHKWEKVTVKKDV